ncbi:MAG: CHAT domain-containing protein [Pseudomonadota bacterium]
MTEQTGAPATACRAPRAAWLACLLAACFGMWLGSARAQKASPKAHSNGDPMNEYVGRWSGTGKFPRQTSIVLTVGASSDLKSCGTLELPELGCKASLTDCSVLNYKLEFRFALEASNGGPCPGIAANSASLDSSGDLEQFIGFRQRTGFGNLSSRTRGNVAEFKSGPIQLPSCDTRAKPTLDLSGDWVVASAPGWSATLIQTGTCVRASVLKEGVPTFDAKGSLSDADLQLKWAAKTGAASGDVVLHARNAQLSVAFSGGQQRWPKWSFMKAPSFAALEAARALLNTALARHGTPAGAANAHALELVLNCAVDAPRSKPSDVWVQGPKVQELCAKLKTSSVGATKPDKAELGLATTKVLFERMAVERAAGRRDAAVFLSEKAKWAATEVGNPQQTMMLQAQIIAATPGVGLFPATMLEQTGPREKAREQLAQQCLARLRNGEWSAARATCKKADESIARLAAPADDRIAAADADGKLQIVKNYEANAENASLASWLQQLQVLMSLARKNPAMRAQAGEFGADVLGKVTRAVLASGTIGDLGTASDALASSGFGYSEVLASVESVEDVATSLALASPQTRGLTRAALDILSLRSGKGTDVATEIARLSRPQSKDDFVTLRGLRAAVARDYFSGRVPESAPLLQDIDTIQRKIAGIATARLGANGNLSALPGAGQPSQLLAADSVFVAFQRFRPVTEQNATPSDAHYAAFVVRKATEPSVFDLGPAAVLDDAVGAFQGALRNRAPIEDVRKQAKALYAGLLGPLHPSTWKATRWFVAPDAQLHRLPLAALDDGSGWLLQKYDISYVSSWQDLQREAASAAQPQKLLNVVVFADPEKTSNGYADRAFQPASYSDLSGAPAEAVQITKIFGASKVTSYLKQAAKESTFLAQAEPTILHVATHGMSLQEQSAADGNARGLTVDSAALEHRARIPSANDTLLRSFLVLAGDQSGSDGLATAYEISTMDLVGTQLVVLSACQTAEGDVASWFGVHSLQQAFRIAGARNVVASLWPVDDTATLPLMTSVYQSVAQGKPYGAALHAAMRALLARSKPDNPSEHPYEHPYFWAPFILNGTGTARLAATSASSP